MTPDCNHPGYACCNLCRNDLFEGTGVEVKIVVGVNLGVTDDSQTEE